MPLQDHFHPPLAPRRRWTSFHASWATFLSSLINRQLPPGYYAEPLSKFVVEIDVATFQRNGDSGDSPAGWTPPRPALTIATAPATDAVEVQVFHTADGDQTLAGCIELVSPSNKDRPSEREAFVSKCATYLHEGAGLLVVEVVTDRHASLHQALLARLAPGAEGVLTTDLYAAAYRPVAGKDETSVGVWQEALALGQPLPAMPLWLRGGFCLQIDLEAAYELTRRELRLITNGAPGDLVTGANLWVQVCNLHLPFVSQP